MTERQYDRELGIKTEGLREWRQKPQYNRYEATPYHALDKFSESYKFKNGGRVVDFGCGRGRVSFYLHKNFGIPVVGIEAHDRTYAEALENKSSYRTKAVHIEAPIKFKYGLAEEYVVKPHDTYFYFFNPFSEEIFAKVVNNIMKSLKKHPRVIDLILYYPLPGFKEILESHTFRLINKVKVPRTIDWREKFLIYRHDEFVKNNT